jgi:hypothetical protein
MSNSTSNKINDLLVVIRGSNERTEELCIHLAKEQVPEDHVVVIHERPFSEAVRKGFQIGLDFALKWTLYLDADILLCKNALSDLVGYMEQQPDTSLGGHGKLLDKFIARDRFGGPHLYRTSLLEKALNVVPDAAVSLRPETYAKSLLAKQGHDWIKIRKFIAIHDFEQSYSDIYRKMVVRANKSKNKPLTNIFKQAENRSRLDKDFLVALWGLRIGHYRNENILLDSEQWRAEAETLIVANAFSEKAPIIVKDFTTLSDTILQNFLTYGELQPNNKIISLVRKLFYQVRKHAINSLSPAARTLIIRRDSHADR